MADAPRYAIGDLADLAGVSRRTVRYYVQEGVLPAPFGVGRGNHYGREHLERILQVKALQEAGRTLDDIRRALRGHDDASVLLRPLVEAVPPLPRTTWRRFVLAPGVELNVSSDVRLPTPAKLQQLSEWCHAHFSNNSPKDDEDADA
jgi:DNA-binding transcriptional MerR regulator